MKRSKRRPSVIRQVTLAMASLTLVLVCALPALPEIPAQNAERFIDSIGVCTHWSYPDTPYGFAFEAVKRRLIDSGIRHVRDGPSPRLSDLGKAGIRATVAIDADKPIAESLENLKKAIAAGALIDAVEGPNEPDLFWKGNKRSYQGHGFEQGDAGIIEGVIAFQKDLYTAIKSDPALASIKVIGPSLGKTYGYDTKSPYGIATLNDAVDWGNFHPYPGGNPFSVPAPYAGLERYTWYGGHPSSNIDEFPYAFDVYAPPFAPKPMAATETGYSTFADGPSETTVTKYVLRLFCEYFGKGIQRTYLYELVDEFNRPADREGNFGLIRFDGSPKPSYVALRRLIRLLESPGPVPAVAAAIQPALPPPLAASVSVSAVRGFDRTQYVHSIALQRRDGVYFLLIWHEIALDDSSKKPWRRLPLAPAMPATIKLAQPAAHAEVFIPNDGDEPVQNLTKTDTIELHVPDRMMVVRIAF